MNKDVFIFDLDGTVIDSSHRQTIDPKTGKLDLQAWRYNNTPEQILADTALPLFDTMLELIDASYETYILTARDMVWSDFILLHKLGCKLEMSHIIGRHLVAQDIKDLSDHEYKAFMFKHFIEKENCDYVFFDDCEENLDALEKFGVLGIDANNYASFLNNAAI